MGKSFYFYIDDSGTRFPDRVPLVTRADGIDCFALGGILIADADRVGLRHAHQDFCARWNITAPLHSTKIRGRRDAFAWLGEDPNIEQKFLADLERLMLRLPILGFATVIDRPGYNRRYAEKYGEQRWLMCKSAYIVLIERVCKYVDSQGGTLTVRFEESGKNEDRAMIAYAKEMKQASAPFDPSNSLQYKALSALDYQRIIQGEPSRVTKKNSPAAQFADLFLYPIVKAGYDPRYRSWQAMMEAKKVIDALLTPEERPFLGIKYSCFETPQKRKA